jgi:hypothetical protein
LHTPFGELPEHLASRLTMAEQFDYLRGGSRRRFHTASGLALDGVATTGL